MTAVPGLTTGPASALADLHRAGQLAAEYPAVARLVADLSGHDLLRAGQVLARLDADEVLRAHSSTPVVSVALTGHGTVGPLVPVLTAELARHGLLLRPLVSGYGGYVFDLSDAGSALYAAGADLVLCLLDPAVVMDEVPLPWQPADVAQVAGRKVALLAELSGRFEAAAHGTLVLNTLPLPRRIAGQLIDHRSRALLGAVWREANARLLRLTEARRRLVVLDLDPLLAEGCPAVEARLDVYAGVHLSPDLLAAYAREVGHLARHVVGRTRKCLALDLDNTVWGGTLGDDGVDGIEVSGGYRGEAFRAFQRVVKQIGAQGVLVAAVSKNDPELVRAALEGHPEMALRDADLVRVVANWRPKHENLVQLADSLNLAVDSLVFVDDSPYERELVRRELPGVVVVPVDDEPALHAAALLHDGWFDCRELTEEDRDRGDRYREDLDRESFLARFDSIDEYLRELEIRTTLTAAGESETARLSQLTLRTNQFNLTGNRLQASDVLRLAHDPEALVLAIRTSDRFGDSGLVGAVFARRANDAVHIDNFLLSCRVFSRGIEQACLSSVLLYARGSGASAVYGTYRPTARNGGVRDFYQRYGFEPAGDDGTTWTFRHDLVEVVPVPGHVLLDADFGGGEPRAFPGVDPRKGG